MGKKIKFKFKEVAYKDKVLVYVDYIDRKFFNSNFNDVWEYDNIDFSIVTYMSIEKGDLNIEYNKKGKIILFQFYIGTKENCFVINKKDIKLFKDLENIVYNDIKKSLSDYLVDNKYYFIDFKKKYLSYFLDYYNFKKDNIDKKYFLSGNMFNNIEEIRKIVKKLNIGEITIKEVKEERQKFFKNYVFK